MSKKGKKQPRFDDITNLKRKYSRKKMDTLFLELHLIIREIEKRIEFTRKGLDKLSSRTTAPRPPRKGKVLTVGKTKNKKKSKKK